MTQNELTTIQTSDLALAEPQGLDRNPAAVYLASLSESGRRTMRQALDVIAGILTGNANCLSCNWAALRFQHTAAIRSRLADTYAPATANKMLCALRRVLKTAWQLELMTAEEYQRARDVDRVEGETLPAGRALSEGEIGALLQACENDPDPAGVRDAALIVCMYPGGLRRDEVIKLDFSDYNPETNALKVSGKRRKERLAYLTNGAARAMADWLALRGCDPGPLLWPINKGDALQPRRLTSQAIYNALQKRGKEAGVVDLSPHDLRRTFITHLLEAGADIAIIAKMAGHASVTTTARYDRRPEEAKRKAAGLLHVPYRGRMTLPGDK